MASDSQYGVVDEVVTELDRACRKFPNQSWEWGGDAAWTREADAQKRANDAAVQHGSITWLDILAEEFYEAAAETDPERIYEELVQVGAMAIRAAHDVKRRAAE